MIMTKGSLNKYFSVEDAIGIEITEDEFHCLLAEKKLYGTTCRMNGIEAARAMGRPLEEFALEERTYGGLIIADTYDEAVNICNKRGLGETADGVLEGILPYDHVNPFDTSKQTN